MEQQTKQATNQQQGCCLSDSVCCGRGKTWLIVAVIVAAFVAGGLVYIWQQKATNTILQGLQTQILNLQNQIMKKNPPVAAIPAPDATANWQSYRNDKYGFEIKYLPTMMPLAPQSDMNGDFIQFSGNTVSATISVLTAKKYASLNAFLEETDKIQAIAFEGTPSVRVNKQNNITVDEYQAIQREQFLIAAGIDDVSAYFLKNGVIFWISIQSVPPSGTAGSVGVNNLLDISNKMLSTFKFTK